MAMMSFLLLFLFCCSSDIENSARLQNQTIYLIDARSITRETIIVYYRT